MTEEEKKKKIEEDKKKAPVFEMYEIKVQATVPCTISYRVRAETPEDALKLIDKQHPNGFQPILARRKFIKATVFNAGTLNIRATKTYRY
jgi:hypothetical protein